MKLLLLTKDLADNSTGRAQVLWTLARSLGWDVEVVAPVGHRMWGPAQGTEFSRNCHVIADDRELKKMADSADLLIAVKPQPGSFGRADRLRTTTPILLDIDDPDLESTLSEGHPLKAIVKAFVQAPRYWSAVRLRRRVAHYPKIVSNPVLQQRYGGRIVPHARDDTGPGAPHLTDKPTIVFVGTNRRHKGIDVLRAAVQKLAHRGLRLIVTDVAPEDARPHEEWVGQTNLDQGRRLVKSGDIVVIPSMPGEIHSLAQLPAKLIDAMLAARAVIISDFAPLRWAVGDTGRIAEPGDVDSLVARLEEMCDPTLRSRLGAAARERACAEFTVERVRATFESACRDAAGQSSRNVSDRSGA